MTPAEEDALVSSCYVDCKIARVGQEIYSGKTLDEPAIRLAIRAAVAQERERCAKVCESLTSGEFWNPSPDDCAAAIRRGE